MIFQSIVLAAFAAAAQALSLEACSTQAGGTCPCPCEIMTCPDGLDRNAFCECPAIVDPVVCDRNQVCWNGRPKDKYCMCPPQPVCPIDICPDGKPRSDTCECPHIPDPPVTCSDVPCWDGSARTPENHCMCPEVPCSYYCTGASAPGEDESSIPDETLGSSPDSDSTVTDPILE